MKRSKLQPKGNVTPGTIRLMHIMIDAGVIDVPKITALLQASDASDGPHSGGIRRFRNCGVKSYFALCEIFDVPARIPAPSPVVTLRSREDRLKTRIRQLQRELTRIQTAAAAGK
jgi:hypothetical protein